jgi:hypothetical protein
VRIFRLLPLLILFPAFAHAGAWTQKDNHGLLIAQATYFTGDQFFDADGNLQKQSRFSKIELQPYGEYGINDAITVGGTAFIHSVSQSGDTNYGLADPEIFLRTRLWHNDTSVLSLQPLIKLPSAYTEHGKPRGGNTAFDGELSVLYGRTIPILSDRDYLDTRLGYRLRGHSLHAQYKADIALGLNLNDAVQIIPAIRGIMTPDLEEATFSQTGELDYDLLKAEITTVYRLNDTQWIQAALFYHLAGRQAGAGQGISVGFAQEF